MNRGGLFGLQHFLYSPFYLCLLDMFNCQDLKIKVFYFHRQVQKSSFYIMKLTFGEANLVYSSLFIQLRLYKSWYHFSLFFFPPPKKLSTITFTDQKKRHHRNKPSLDWRTTTEWLTQAAQLDNAGVCKDVFLKTNIVGSLKFQETLCRSSPDFRVSPGIWVWP